MLTVWRYAQLPQHRGGAQCPVPRVRVQVLVGFVLGVVCRKNYDKPINYTVRVISRFYFKIISIALFKRSSRFVRIPFIEGNTSTSGIIPTL